MNPVGSNRRAFLVLGPESSGTRLMAQILINAGCAGSADHEQPFDDENYNLCQHPLIVWRRSVPHNGESLDLPRMYYRLGIYSTDIRAIVMTRDLHSMVQSQIRDCQHANSEIEAQKNVQRAYTEIFSQLDEYSIPFVIVPYESLVLGGDLAQRHLLDCLGLALPQNFVPIYNGNDKYWQRLSDTPASINFSSSFVVKAEHFRRDWFTARCPEMGFQVGPGHYHRKIWECVVIAESIYRHFNGNLTGLSALGFGVGRDPIACWLVSKGVRVLATDCPSNNPAWTSTGQHAGSLEDIFKPEICSRERFMSLASFRPVDIRQIPQDLKSGHFDITYSCGSFEHIGGITAGTEFFVGQMQCLKPGGIAVHTTEFNPDLKSTGRTIDSPDLCLFRESDLLNLRSEVVQRGYNMGRVDLSLGTEPEDEFIDKPPYSANGPHIRIQVGDCVTTSILLNAGVTSL